MMTLPIRKRLILCFFVFLVLGMIFMGLFMISRPTASMAFVGGIGGLVLFLVVGIGLRQWVLRPIADLQQAVVALDEGEIAQVHLDVGDEDLAVIGQELTKLAASSRERFHALETEQAKILAILENMVVGIIALDESGRIHYINPCARNLFELGVGEGEGRLLLEVLRHRGLADFVDHAQALGRDGGYHEEVEFGLSKRRVLDVNSLPIPLGAATTGVLLIFHDITELRRLEQARVEFVANVSHELRTPLTAIKGYLETLLDETPSEESTHRRFLEVVNTHTDRLGRLVDDLLQLSNIETGRVVLRSEPIALAEFMTEVSTMFEKKLSQKKMRLENSIASHWYVYADRDRLTQIFVNLINNALLYTPEGGTVTLTAHMENDGFVAIGVRDTGQGIPAASLPRLTERFYRVDKARSRERGGTGLGLAIVKHLVQLHGGRLHIESELNKGTSVQVALPPL